MPNFADAVIKTTQQKDITTIKFLIRHAMETGMRKDEDDKLVPISYIKQVWIEKDGKKLMQAHWGVSMAKDPFTSIQLTGLKKGDALVLFYQTDKGDTKKIGFNIE